MYPGRRTLAYLLVALALVLYGCDAGSGGGGELTIDAPDSVATLLSSGAGEDFTYYALKASPPGDWTDASAATLWICSQAERPPIIPQKIAAMIDGGGFPAGTLLNLNWEAQEGIYASSELGFSAMQVTVGVTYAGCTSDAVEAAGQGSGALLLTDSAGEFDDKARMVAVVFK